MASGSQHRKSRDVRGILDAEVRAEQGWTTDFIRSVWRGPTRTGSIESPKVSSTETSIDVPVRERELSEEKLRRVAGQDRR
jgi:hypothetical protein